MNSIKHQRQESLEPRYAREYSVVPQGKIKIDRLQPLLERRYTLLENIRTLTNAELLTKYEFSVYEDRLSYFVLNGVTEGRLMDKESYLLRRRLQMEQPNTRSRILQTFAARSSFPFVNGTWRIHFSRCAVLLREEGCVVGNGVVEVDERGMETLYVEEQRGVRVPAVKDERIVLVWEKIQKRHAGTAAVVTGEVRSEDIEELSSYFPPCITSLYERLKVDRHLKYNGRIVMNLFLKGVGMPVDENIAFWKKHFKKDFKEYVYSVRHHYGLEGKRANYGCYTCKKIQSLNLCPYAQEGSCQSVFKERGGEGSFSTPAEFFAGLRKDE